MKRYWSRVWTQPVLSCLRVLTTRSTSIFEWPCDKEFTPYSENGAGNFLIRTPFLPQEQFWHPLIREVLRPLARRPYILPVVFPAGRCQWPTKHQFCRHQRNSGPQRVHDCLPSSPPSGTQSPSWSPWELPDSANMSAGSVSPSAPVAENLGQRSEVRGQTHISSESRAE